MATNAAVEERPPLSRGGRRHLQVYPQDNVTTMLDDDRLAQALEGGGRVAPGVPFGHKAALRDIREGEVVVKYGVAIGRATAFIAAGEHVHVHNCR